MAAQGLSSESSQEVFQWLKSLPLAPEYRPTLAEFQDPIAYIFKIEKEASKYGICKIVPPVPPASKKTTISNLNRSLAARAGAQGGACRPTFTTRQQQIGFCPRRPRPVQRPVWQSGENYTFQEFEAKAKSFEKSYFRKFGKKHSFSPLEVETLYWKATVDKPFSVEYANDMPGSAFVPVGAKKREPGDGGGTVGETAWNMRRVSRSEGSLLRFMKEEIPGVTSPMVYIAMMFSWFAWHVEDHDLHSLNYMHMGAGKTWYGVPRDAAVAFEEVVRVHGYGGEVNPLVTFATLGEKTTVMSPEVFIGAGIPCCRLVQNAGEFVVTFPRAYHSGFSHGFNCGEAANIATPEWLKFAKDAAIRRASINYRPMVSHFQLLYDLSLALCSRPQTSPNCKPRSSRLKEKKKSEGEKLVKELFVQNVIQNNELLFSLGEGSSIVLLPRGSADTSVCSDLRVGSQLQANPKMLIGLYNHKDTMNPEGLDSELPSKDGIESMNRSFSVKEKFTSLCERNRKPFSDGNTCQPQNTYTDRKCTSQADGLSDQRLFSCLTCGILSFDCLAIVQPRKEAARYLMSADCSFFNDWIVGSGVVRNGLGCGDTKCFEPKPHEKQQKGSPNSLCHVPGRMADYEIKMVDQSHVMPAAKAWKETSALGLLASTYGDSSDSEEDQAEADLPSNDGEAKLADCSAERRYQHNNTSVWPGDTSEGRCQLLSRANCVDEGSPQVVNCHEERKDQSLVSHAFSSSALSYPNVQNRFSKGAIAIENIEMPFLPRSDEDSSRMHIFCLQHAVEVEQQLRQIGGADIMLLCHPDYPRIEAEAKLVAEEHGLDHHWNDLTFRDVTREDELKIQSALDSEDREATPVNSDWAVKLGINLFFSSMLSRSPLYSKQMPYNSVIYNVFGRSSPSSPEASDQRSCRTRKVVVGKWCGKVWMSNQVHPFLAPPDPEEQEMERSAQYPPLLPNDSVEKRPGNFRRAETSVVTRKYSRKRKTKPDAGVRKKIKSAEIKDSGSDDTSEDHPYKKHWRSLGSDQEQEDSYYEREDKGSCDSLEQMYDNASDDELEDSSLCRKQHRGILRGKQIKEIESEDEVSDDSLRDSSDLRRICARKQAVFREDAVSDDEVAENPRQRQRNTPRGRRDEFSDSSVDDDAQPQMKTDEEDNMDCNSQEDNSCGRGKRALRKRRVKARGLRQELEIPQPTKRGRTRVIKQLKMKQETRQLPNVKREESSRLLESCIKEDPVGGRSRRLRKRVMKPSEDDDVRSKAKEKKPTSKNKPKTASTSKILMAEESEFQCDIEGCTMSFATKQHLALHKRNVCPVKGCGKKFFSHKYLVQHRRVHLDDRPLKCPWKGCKMTFKWAWARTEHIRVHTGARPYVCAEPGCGQTFRFVSDFSRHKRKTGHSVKKSKR